MPVCSYVVISEKGSANRVGRALSAITGCEVSRARNRDLMILVTDTPDREQEEALRRRVEAVDGVRALLLTFGEVEPPHVGPRDS